MELIVSHQCKRVEIWLTAAENADSARVCSLAPLFSVYHKRKYTVVVFVSGSHDFYRTTLDLLTCNKNRAVALAARQAHAARCTSADSTPAAPL